MEAEELQEGPADGLQEGPTEGPQGGPTKKLQEGRKEERQEGPADELQEGPADEPQEGPTEELQEDPAKELQRGPAPEEEGRDFAFTRATFGGVAAGLPLEVAKQRAAEEGGPRDPLEAQQIKEKIDVDKGAMGGKPSDVERMKRKKIASGQYDNTK